MPAALHRSASRIVGLLLAVVLVIAGALASTGAANAAEGVGAISGTVTDESGAPVENIEVVAHRYNADWDYWGWQSSVVTGSDGSYWLPELPAGEYKMQFATEWSGTGLVAEWWEDAADEWSATPIVLEAEATLADVSPVLAVGGSISGVVTTTGGEPIEGVEVLVYEAESGAHKGTVVTGSDGSYAFPGLPAGDYRVQFETAWAPVSVEGEWWDDARSWDDATLVTVTAGSDATGISPALSAANSISGVITDDQGAPAPYVNVVVYDAEGGWQVTSAASDEYGDFVVRGLPDGSYHLHFDATSSWSNLAAEWWRDAPDREAATVISVAGGEVVSDVSPSLSPGGAISGTVTRPDGTPLQSGRVTVYAYDPESLDNWTTSDWVNGDGTYVIDGLPTGAYQVRVDPESTDVSPEWWEDAVDQSAATVLEVVAGATISGIDFALALSGGVRGTVTDEAGTPAPGVLVTAHPQRETDAWGVSVRTDESGAYELAGLLAGDYKIEFSTDEASVDVASEWWQDAADESSAAVVSVVGGTMAQVDAVLSPAARLAGTVTDADGQPLVDVHVWAYRGDEPAPFAATTTDSEGAYRLRGLPPGDYAVLFTSYGDDVRMHEWWSNAPTRELAAVVALTAGQVIDTLDAVLAESDGSVVETFDAALSGRVLDALGQPIAGAMVTFDSPSNQFGDGTMTGPNGEWSFRHLPAGSYRLGFSATFGDVTVTEWWENAADAESADLISLARGEQRSDLDVVLALPASPAVESSVPQIEGPPRVGSTLSVELGVWTPDTEFSYQWFAEGEPIDGATSPTLAPAAEHVGKRLTVAVTGSLAGHTSVTELSERSAPIKPEKLKKTAPSRVTTEPVPAAS